MKTNAIYITVVLGAVLSNPVYAQSADQQRAETACQFGNRQAGKELIVWANGYCKRGDREACEYIIRANEVMQSGGDQSTERSSRTTNNGVDICVTSTPLDVVGQDKAEQVQYILQNS